jgi:hypothetical protein
MGLSSNYRAAVVASVVWAIGFTIWHRMGVLETATGYFNAIQSDCLKNKLDTLTSCMDGAWDVRDSYMQAAWRETGVLLVLTLMGLWLVGGLVYGAYRWIDGGD